MFSMSRESPRAAKLVSLWPDDLSPIDKMFLHGEKRKRREGNTANAIRRGGGVCGFVEKAIAPGQSECHWAYFYLSNSETNALANSSIQNQVTSCEKGKRLLKTKQKEPGCNG